MLLLIKASFYWTFVFDIILDLPVQFVESMRVDLELGVDWVYYVFRFRFVW